MCPLVVSSCSVKHAIVSLAPGCCCFVFPSAEQQRRTRCSSYSNNRFVVSVVKKTNITVLIFILILIFIVILICILILILILMLIFILSRTQELWSPPSVSSQRFEHALNRLS